MTLANELKLEILKNLTDIGAFLSTNKSNNALISKYPVNHTLTS